MHCPQKIIQAMKPLLAKPAGSPPGNHSSARKISPVKHIPQKIATKGPYASILFLIYLFTNALLNAQGQIPSAALYDRLGEAKALLHQKKTTQRENSTYADYDLVYQRMEWRINPEIHYIRGSVTSRFLILDPELEFIQFDLTGSLRVDSVIRQGKQLLFSHENDLVHIRCNQGFNVTGIDSVTLFYQGTPEDVGMGAFVQSEHNHIPILWTLSEPYGAKYWWPCKQSLFDKIDSMDVVVTSPESYRTASNGILLSETVSNGYRTMHWKHRYPIATYLVGIAVTNYVDYSDFVVLPDNRILEIQNFVYPEEQEKIKQKTPQTIEILNLYNELFGVYPFADEKYGHAQFGWGGGMEHQTMSFLSDFGFDLIAHELAHQWFGNYVTLSSWHDIWLNEGFATWATGLAYENLLEGVWWPVWREQLIRRITSEPGGSVYVADTTDIPRIFNGRLSYSKGAYLLHMLRWILGDQKLLAAIQSYLNDPATAYGFATHEKFVEHLETQSDTTLDEFFNDWYYGEGFPIYSASYAQNEENLLQITLFQETSHSSVPFFEMPVPIRCYNQSETDSSDFRLNHTFSGQEFFVDPGFTVEHMKIDPERWLIAKKGDIMKVPWLYKNNRIRLSPNPVKKYLYVSVPVNKMDVYTQEGILIKHFPSSQQKIFLGDLPLGMYVIKGELPSGQFIQKIVKQ
jgi:aminopeptidase N